MQESYIDKDIFFCYLFVEKPAATTKKYLRLFGTATLFGTL